MELSITKNNIGRVKSSQDVSTANFCLICLATDCKLYPMGQYNLGEAYQHLTGKLLLHNFALEFCTECAQRLLNCNKFRDKSLRSYTLLMELWKNNNSLTTQDISTINRATNKLTTNLSAKVFEPDHCDSHYVHHQIEHIKIEIDCEPKVDVKPKIEAINDINSDDEFLNDDIDNDTDFLYNAHKIKQFKIDTRKIERSGSDSDVERIIDKKNRNDSEIVIVDAAKIKAVNAKKSTTNTKKRKAAMKKEKAAPKPKKQRTINEKERKKPVKSENQDYLKYFVVTKLSHEEQLATIQSRKEADNFKNSLYKCMTCYKGFSTVTTYNTHLEKHSDKYGQFVCEICGVRCKKNCKLRDHVVKNHSQRYSCNTCPLVTTFKKTAQNHALWHDGVTYKCELCNEEYSKKTSYLSHLRVRHPTDVVCTLCGFSFVNARGLRMHCNLKHRSLDTASPSGPLCEPCDIRFVSHSAYRQHLDVSPKHSNSSFLKRNCPKKIYDKQFTVKAKDDTDTVVCEQCNMQFEGFKMYASHFKKYHSDKKRTQYPQHSAQRFLCDQCARSFKNLAALKEHMLMHSGHRKYECAVCGKRFYLKHYLALHVRAHGAAERFPCAVCGKSFVNKANRTRHMWTHRDLKPFECAACDKTYVNASSLRSHVLHAHLKQPWPKKSRGPRVPARSAPDAGCDS
ncbi:zinc finger protein 808 isoform X2 [Bicyclus anynana]|nr:zinc finger protein 808 isoform X2 [Bicyclus anynana]